MNDSFSNDFPELVIEPERYEFHTGPAYHFAIDRRQFFKTLGCGIVVLLFIDAALAQESGGGGRRGAGRGRQGPTDLSAWLHIGEDGTVTVFTGKVELGQNIRTSLTQAVAEELHAPIDSIRLVMADTDLTPWDAGTFGSQTTPTMAPQIRRRRRPRSAPRPRRRFAQGRSLDSLRRLRQSRSHRHYGFPLLRPAYQGPAARPLGQRPGLHARE